MRQRVDFAAVTDQVETIAAKWRADRPERQMRRSLDRADFDALRDAGLLALIAPVDAGGAWESAPASLRSLCEIYRRLG
jgi:alkylation response protein AidB-like acyl-CoA dehydrogenase